MLNSARTDCLLTTFWPNAFLNCANVLKLTEKSFSLEGQNKEKYLKYRSNLNQTGAFNGY
jgi:hypothetical protein